MVHDPYFRPIRGRENVSAPPKLESRLSCHDWDRDVFEAFFDPNPQLWTCFSDYALIACVKILLYPIMNIFTPIFLALLIHIIHFLDA